MSDSLLARAAAIILLFLCLPFSLLAHPRRQVQAATQSEVTLKGVIDSSQNHSYVRAPFTVPAGTERVTIAFDYTGKDQHTALDLGLLDPTELRCWSGGN